MINKIIQSSIWYEPSQQSFKSQKKFMKLKSKSCQLKCVAILAVQFLICNSWLTQETRERTLNHTDDNSSRELELLVLI